MSIRFDQPPLGTPKTPPERSVERVVGLRRYVEVVTNKEGMEVTRCANMTEALAVVQVAAMKGATNFSIFILTEKGKQPNSDSTK